MTENHQMNSANARAAAIKRLIESHQDEWEEIYSEERIAHGLPPKRTVGSLMDENLRLRRRIQELEGATQ